VCGLAVDVSNGGVEDEAAEAVTKVKRRK